MNRYLFLTRNVYDKLGKSIRSWDTLKYYVNTYLLSALESVDPDCYIISYPKCGRTWLRVLLQNYAELAGFDIGLHRDGAAMKTAGVTIKFEHDMGNWVPAPVRPASMAFNSKRYASKTVVLLVRDPRDVVVSSWYHQKYRDRVYKGSLSEFVRDEVVGIRKIIRFLNIWIESRDIPEDFMLLQYERLHDDAAHWLRALLDFVRIPADGTLVSEAAERSSFREMQGMEVSGSLSEPWLAVGENSAEKARKIRQGSVGGYKSELSDEDIAFVNEIIERELTRELACYRGVSCVRD